MDKRTVERFLDEQGTVLWGRSFDVVNDDSRQQAVEFIMKLWWDLDAIDMSLQFERLYEDKLPYA